MTKKIALVFLNPLTSEQDSMIESGSYFSERFKNKQLIPFPLTRSEKKDPKLLMKILGTGTEIPSDEDQLFELLKTNGDSSFKRLIKHLQDHKGTLHILLNMGSAYAYLEILFKKRNQEIPVSLHLGIEKNSLEKVIQSAQAIEQLQQQYPFLTLASLSGATFLFNQDQNWQDLQKAYDEIAFNQTQSSFSLSTYLEKQFENGISPEKIAPVSFVEGEPLEEADALLILETDSEKIELITKAFEVSKHEEKKSDFGNFNPIGITKNLPNLYLITAKKPYSEYENESLLAPKSLSTLSETLAKHEIRQLYLADQAHFKLITKYLNNEQSLIFDGQKNLECQALIADNKELLQTAQETILKTFASQIPYFEAFIIAWKGGENDTHALDELFTIAQKEEIGLCILDFPEKKARCSESFLPTGDAIHLKSLRKRIEDRFGEGKN